MEVDRGKEGDGLAVICAATPWDGTKFQDRHLAERLSLRRPVLYVDPPLSPVEVRHKPWLADSLRGPKLRILNPRLARLTVVVTPFPERPGVTALTGALYRRRMAAAARHLGGRVDAVITSDPLLRVFGACGEAVRIYWAQDDHVGGAAMSGFSPDRIARTEPRRVAEAHHVVASNPDIAATWGSRQPSLIPFGVDDEAFAGVDSAPDAPDVTLAGPVIGFVGGLVPGRVDLPMIEAVAERGRSLLMVGPAHRDGLGQLRSLVERPNVQWVGAKPFEALPSYLRAIDVGIVPYADTAFNRGSFPLKTLEYLAAGIPVVASDLPAMRWLGTDLVTIAGTPEAFADAVDAAAAAPRDPTAVAARREFAHRHSWDRRAAEFDELISRLACP